MRRISDELLNELGIFIEKEPENAINPVFITLFHRIQVGERAYVPIKVCTANQIKYAFQKLNHELPDANRMYFKYSLNKDSEGNILGNYVKRIS